MSEHSRPKIAVVSYNPAWPLSYEAEKVRLLEALAPHLVAVEHAGSTSIPDQDAKPVIDIFAAVRPFLESPVYAKIVGELGYMLTDTGMSGRYFFVREAEGSPAYHLHLLPAEGFYERKELLFRDYLRAHPELVREYGALKRSLAERYRSNPEAYTRAKTAFIQHVVDQARTERGLPLQDVWES